MRAAIQLGDQTMPTDVEVESLERADSRQREAIRDVSNLHVSLAEEVRAVNVRLDRLEAGASRGGKWLLLVWMLSQLLGLAERNLWRFQPARTPASKEAPVR